MLYLLHKHFKNIRVTAFDWQYNKFIFVSFLQITLLIDFKMGRYKQPTERKV